MHIHFFGATREVTGSCQLIEINNQRLLVDCGLIQGGHKDEERNAEPFPFDPADIDAVILTHAHIDHSGRLPLLVKKGFNGTIYTHSATRDLCRIMLKDSAFLNEKDVEWDNRKRQRKGLPLLEPLYSIDDAAQAMRHFKAMEYNIDRQILPGVTLRLRDAGHILGSAIAELTLEENDTTRRLVFSGDLGQRGVPILRDYEYVQNADLVIMESTYGDRLHRDWDATWQEMAEVIQEADRNRGNILIPAFAVGRTQELLYVFQRNFKAWNLDRWNVFLDSPMAIQATEVYSRHWNVYDKEAAAQRGKNGDPFTLPNLHMTRTANQSMALNRVQSGAIIIAGSGMCTGGRIRHHFKHNIWREHTHVLIVGFQARGTLGRKLVDGAKRIRLWGETMKVAAQIHTIGGLSAHADQSDLLDWYGHFDHRPPVALIHGEPEAMDVLAEKLRDEVGVHVLTPQHGEKLDLITMR